MTGTASVTYWRSNHLFSPTAWRRLIAAVDDAGAVNSLIPIYGWLDATTFLTKAGELGAMYLLTGADPDGLDDATRATQVARYQQAVLTLPSDWAVTQYAIKDVIDPLVAPACTQPVAAEVLARRTALLNTSTLYRLDRYLVVLYDGLASPWATLAATTTSPWATLKARLATPEATTFVQQQIDRALATLQQTLQPFESILADTICPVRLDQAAMYRVLRRLVNYDRTKFDAPLHQTHVDYWAAASTLEVERDHLRLDDEVVQTLTMKEPPTQTFATILNDLYRLACPFVAAITWRAVSQETIRHRITTRRKFFHNKKTSIQSELLARDGAPDSEKLIDVSAMKMTALLGDALTEVETQHAIFGSCSFTLALHAADRATVRAASAEAQKLWLVQGGALFQETYNQLNAWAALLPGGHRLDRRALVLDGRCLADLSFLFAPDSGETHGSHFDAPLAIFDTETGVPYRVHLHVQDVGHTVICGAPGVGKSYATNLVSTHLQQYDPTLSIIDIGRSYRKLATLLDGAYLELQPEAQATTLNPLAEPLTDAHRHFLHAFLRVLMEGRAGPPLTGDESHGLFDAITRVYVVADKYRHLTRLHEQLPPSLKPRLAPWIQGGPYGGLFDHVHETLDVKRLQVFEFEPLNAFPDLLDPMLFYVLRKIAARADARQGFTVCILDEAWRLIQHPAVRGFLIDCLKTWRKKNAALILVTHTIEDFGSPDLLRAVIENCPTTWFLPNPGFDQDRYAALFKLNAAQLALIARAQPRRQFVLHRPGVDKLLTLRTDPLSHWVYTNTPLDNAQFDHTIRQYGFTAGLDRLAAGVSS